MSTLKVNSIQKTDSTTLVSGSSGTVISVSMVRNGTRTSVSNSTEFVLFSGTFTKQRSDTDIIATCTVFGAQYSSGNCGAGMKLGNNWDYGCAYQYDGAFSATAQTTIIIGSSRWSGASIGSNTIGFGWKTINGSSDRPFAIFNPNSTDDARNQQMVSSIVIYEVIP